MMEKSKEYQIEYEEPRYTVEAIFTLVLGIIALFFIIQFSDLVAINDGSYIHVFAIIGYMGLIFIDGLLLFNTFKEIYKSDKYNRGEQNIKKVSLRAIKIISIKEVSYPEIERERKPTKIKYKEVWNGRTNIK